MRSIIYLFLLSGHFVFAQFQSSHFPDIPYTALFQVETEGNFIYTFGTCDVGMVSSSLGADWTHFESEITVNDIKIVPNTNGAKAFIMDNDEILVFDGKSASLFFSLP